MTVKIKDLNEMMRYGKKDLAETCIILESKNNNLRVDLEDSTIKVKLNRDAFKKLQCVKDGLQGKVNELVTTLEEKASTISRMVKDRGAHSMYIHDIQDELGFDYHCPPSKEQVIETIKILVEKGRKWDLESAMQREKYRAI